MRSSSPSSDIDFITTSGQTEPGVGALHGSVKRPMSNISADFIAPVLVLAQRAKIGDALSHNRPFCALTGNGEIAKLDRAQAAKFVAQNALLSIIVCHAPFMRQKLELASLPVLDILELYAFVHPTRFATPTPMGIAKALGVPISADDDPADLPLLVLECARSLLYELSQAPNADRLATLAVTMGQNGRGWGWSEHILAALNRPYDKTEIINSTRQRFNVWADLPEWAETPPPPPHSNHLVSAEETRERLAEFLHTKHRAEARPEQIYYATRIAQALAPPVVKTTETPAQEPQNEPNIILAEAGTGIGKTLGYLAPASIWAEKNAGSVWISTYTKNLQRQIGGELARLYPDRELREKKVTIRKGRENYICLLNFEDLAASIATTRNPLAGVAAGLMARWIMASEDGDMTGAGFHGWLPGLMGQNLTFGLADRRGECIYSACDHYHRCFVERAIRQSSRTPLVIANHAIIMIKAAHHDDDLPPHLIFDEAHHIFDAADSTFCAELTGTEMHDLHRWLAGPEGVARSRARGLKKRLLDLVDEDAAIVKLMEEVIHRAHFLPAFDWLKRIANGTSHGCAEIFLAQLYAQVRTRTQNDHHPYALETDPFPLNPDLIPAAGELHDAIKLLCTPMVRLASNLREKLASEVDKLSTDTRKRLDVVAASLERRVRMLLTPWIGLLADLLDGRVNADYVDWMEINRLENHIFDIGLHRHFVDPLKPMGDALKSLTHSVTMTSATLRDVADDRASNAVEDDNSDLHQNGWDRAQQFTGARYLNKASSVFSIPSPYDYQNQTRVFIANDLDKNDLKSLGRAYESLFLKAGGGALGIFTSISRLRKIHSEIALPLSDAGLALYAQHVDGIETGTLVDMFRDDVHSCLLGTDAVRDGVDVPGDALRMIVFDRVPWPRRTILHRARRTHFGGGDYDDHLTRLKLKQAYGRLVRTKTDHGIFVMLDAATPSRLLNAFPRGVSVQRLGIADIIRQCEEFWSR